LALALVALPPTSATGAPKFTSSIVNCTVPVGLPDPGAVAVTAAVKLTGCMKSDGLTLETTPVAVPAGLTEWTDEGEMLAE